MKIILITIVLCCLASIQPLCCQEKSFNKLRFFDDTSVLSATITANTKKLFGAGKKKGFSLPAVFSTRITDKNINDSVLLEIRGNFRRDNCYMPPLKLNFKYDSSAVLYSLKSVKLVSECRVNPDNEQLLLKEYLIYRIYNLLTEKSFKARLLKLNFKNAKTEGKEIAEYAFILEDVKDLAKRNHCVEWKKPRLRQESTDREQMTMLAIFEYMIGNTDWSVTGGHNTFQIGLKEDTLALPFAVPYDFDFSGLVSAPYAIPAEELNIRNVQQRIYRGFPRTIEEINKVLDVFKQQKENIYSLINKFDLLNKTSKKEMIFYLDEFYATINRPGEVIAVFINDARR
jgi:hypothetical protein